MGSLCQQSRQLGTSLPGWPSCHGGNCSGHTVRYSLGLQLLESLWVWVRQVGPLSAMLSLVHSQMSSKARGSPPPPWSDHQPHMVNCMRLSDTPEQHALLHCRADLHAFGQQQEGGCAARGATGECWVVHLYPCAQSFVTAALSLAVRHPSYVLLGANRRRKPWSLVAQLNVFLLTQRLAYMLIVPPAFKAHALQLLLLKGLCFAHSCTCHPTMRSPPPFSMVDSLETVLTAAHKPSTR